MAELTINLLGEPQVTLAASPLTNFSTAKTAALLYYLAATASEGPPPSREKLAGLLWGERGETQARKSLTKALSTLNKMIGPYLSIDRQGATLNRESDYKVDVLTFEALTAANELPDVEASAAAVTLYRGDFLEGFSVKEAPAFEEWVLLQRERLREKLLHTLDLLVEDALQRAEYATGAQYATRLLTLDPWREPAHRQMMMLLARSGERAAALAHFERSRQLLADEMGIEPVAETVALYEQLKATAAPPPHNLPLPTLFVGREVELAQVVSRLNNSECRLLTLVGPGGVGKTRLAIEGARHFLLPERNLGGAGFADCIYTVNMAALNPEGVVMQAGNEHSPPCQRFAVAIADALRFSLLGPNHVVDQLLAQLRHKTMLLILDNYEPLSKVDPFTMDILQSAPGIKLLVTSRERLNLREEWVMEIGGLQSAGAVELFVHQAERVRSGFALTPSEEKTIARICRLVEGFPLALELAAGWLRVLSCGEIVQEIEKSLDFLHSSKSDVPERHRSMRAVFARSWQRLSPQEQVAFRQLSVFRGGFQRAAAERVAAATLPILSGLVDKSLLRLAHSAHSNGHIPSGGGRYEIHELLRQFAAEELAQAPEEEKRVYADHAAYYADWFDAQTQNRTKKALNEQEFIESAKLQLELENIRAAWEWTMAHGNFEEAGTINSALRLFDMMRNGT
jgi:DNA-binding SARP family transcriptional activator/predicted ATPase